VADDDVSIKQSPSPLSDRPMNRRLRKLSLVSSHSDEPMIRRVRKLRLMSCDHNGGHNLLLDNTMYPEKHL